MKQPLNLFLVLLIVVSTGCHKSSNNYSTTDHTLGMERVHTWTGTTAGFLKGDTTYNGRDTLWALYFFRNITDTSFAVQKINGFLVSVIGTALNYAGTDSVANEVVTFDTTLSGSGTSVLAYYYLRDSMTYEFHQITGFNTSAGQYYQTSMFLHTTD